MRNVRTAECPVEHRASPGQRLSQRAAVPLILLALLLFFLSTVTASITLGETTVTVTLPMGAVLFSLSSFAVVLTPVAVICLGFALVLVLAHGRRGAGAIFALAGTLLFAAFLFLYRRETMNNSLYTLLSDQLKALDVKFKKRDIERIAVGYSPLVYYTVAAGALAALAALPNLALQRERQAFRKTLLPWAYVSPHLLFFIVFFIVPSIYGVYAAFTRWNLFNDPVWVGMENFRTLFFDRANTYSKQMRNGLWNTVKFVLYSVPFCLALPLALALALSYRPRGRTFFQAIYYLPALMSITTVTLTWRNMFVKSYGAISNFLMSPHDWLIPPYSWASLVIVTVWWCTGGTMVIYQSALASIPGDHYEAASVDGANAWQRIWHITLPNIMFMVNIQFLFLITTSLLVFDDVFMMTKGGPGYASHTLVLGVYKKAFNEQNFGMAMSMSVVIFLFALVFSVITFVLQSRSNASGGRD